MNSNTELNLTKVGEESNLESIKTESTQCPFATSYEVFRYLYNTLTEPDKKHNPSKNISDHVDFVKALYMISNFKDNFDDLTLTPEQISAEIHLQSLV